MAVTKSWPRPPDHRRLLVCQPATHVGYELIGAGMLIVAGGGHGLPLDYEELERWTRVGYERGTRSRRGER
jgi:hypothetical protein